MYFILYASCTVLFVLLSLVFLIIVYYYFKMFAAKYYLNKLPMLPQVPVLGCALLFKSTSSLYDNFMSFPKKYGRNYWSMVGLEPVLFTTDAKLVEIILSSAKHIDKPSFYKILGRLLGNGLVGSSGETWRTQRKLMTPTFHFKILEQFMPIFNKHSNELVKRLDVETTTDSTEIHEATLEWSLGQVTETVMGLKPDGTSDDTTLYKKGGKVLLQIAMERIIRPLEFIDYTYYFSRNYWKELKVANTMDRHINTVIKRKEKEYDDGLLEHSKRINENGTKQKVVSLDLLIEYQRKGAQLTETNMRDQAQTIMYAAYDTTAATLAFTIYNLSNYPEVQEKVFEEAYHVLDGDINQEISSAHLLEMKYLDLVLKESLRVTTSIPLIARGLQEDVEYGDMSLPTGLIVAIPLCALHIDPEYFPEPEKFIPERFSPENCKKRPPYAYAPFSAGPRNCIGQKYGIRAAKVGLVKAVLNYRFFSVDHRLSLAAEISLTPKTGVKVGIRRRDLPGH